MEKFESASGDAAVTDVICKNVFPRWVLRSLIASTFLGVIFRF